MGKRFLSSPKRQVRLSHPAFSSVPSGGSFCPGKSDWVGNIHSVHKKRNIFQCADLEEVKLLVLTQTSKHWKFRVL
jgi:hypothetical protein